VVVRPVILRENGEEELRVGSPVVGGGGENGKESGRCEGVLKNNRMPI